MWLFVVLNLDKPSYEVLIYICIHKKIVIASCTLDTCYGQFIFFINILANIFLQFCGFNFRMFCILAWKYEL